MGNNTDSLKIKTLILTSKLISIAGFLWGLMYCSYGMFFSAIFPFSYTFLMSIILFLHQKGHINEKKLVFVVLLLILLLPAFLQWSIGTFVSSGVVVLWSFLAPTGSLLFQGFKQSVLWFIAFLGIILLLVVFEVLTVKGSTPTSNKALIFSVMNISTISSILFYSLSYFAQQSLAKQNWINSLLIEESQAKKELQSKTQNLKMILSEKDIMLKEIHHRVKNNLQIITSLLSLQNNFIKDNETKAIFKKSQFRINSMAIIHEMLYQSGNIAEINYRKYCKQLIRGITQSIVGSDDRIKLKIDISDIYLNIDTSIPLGLIINEIITNSLKYGFPNEMEGSIEIQIVKTKDQHYKMEIKDDGVGFPNDVNHMNSNSLGLMLIHNLSIQLKGNLEKNNTKKGTAYTLLFEEIV